MINAICKEYPYEVTKHFPKFISAVNGTREKLELATFVRMQVM